MNKTLKMIENHFLRKRENLLIKASTKEYGVCIVRHCLPYNIPYMQQKTILNRLLNLKSIYTEIFRYMLFFIIAKFLKHPKAQDRMT